MNDYKPPAGRPYKDWQSVFVDARPMPFTAFNTGYIFGALSNNTQVGSLPPHRDPEREFEYPVMAFHFRHPIQGDVLIDVGFDQAFHDDEARGSLSLLMRLYSKVLNVRYTQREPGIDLRSHLEAKRIVPSHVFLTHLHADHTAGLLSLSSESHLYYGKGERRLLSRLLVGNHLKKGLPTRLLDMSSGRVMDPFDSVLDVFGDGTFWAISTPGHTPDHISYLINTSPNPILIVGDAELAGWAMKEGILVSSTDGAHGRKEARRSADMIRRFHAKHPDVQLWFSHDEEHL